MYVESPSHIFFDIKEMRKDVQKDENQAFKKINLLNLRLKLSEKLLF
jgi:hypothetical protein